MAKKGKTPCPACGNVEAVLLLTQYHCSNMHCRFWSAVCPDCDNTLGQVEGCYVCLECGFTCG